MFLTDDWDPGHMMNGSYGNGTGMMNGGGWLMMLIGLLLLVLVLVGTTIFLALRANGSGPNGRGVGPAPDSPREVLDLRLARGEISPEDYGNTRTLLDP